MCGLKFLSFYVRDALDNLRPGEQRQLPEYSAQPGVPLLFSQRVLLGHQLLVHRVPVGGVL